MIKGCCVFLAAVLGAALSWTTSLHAERSVPFKVGEVLTYNVSWSGYVSAGGATLSVNERRSNGASGAVYYAVAEARPGSLVERLYHLYYKAESFLDTETLRPAVATMYSDERGRTRLRTTKFLPGNVAEIEVKTATLVRSKVPVTAGSYDPLSAIYALRAMPLALRQTVELPVVNNGRMYRVRAFVAGREQVDSALGQLPAWRLALSLTDDHGQPATTRNLTMWLSDDTRRLPLRLAVDLPVGSFELSLASVNAR